jgi:hypothetical protein
MQLVRCGKRDIFFTGCDPNKLSTPTLKELDKSTEFDIKVIPIKNDLTNNEYCSLKNAIVDVIPSDEFYGASLFSKMPNQNIDDILYTECMIFNRDVDARQIAYSLDKIGKIMRK